ncbi:propanediol utilization protein [Thioclava litoralis]|uniref:Propanediol utilization protein n=1 Tax=Thioclava litoralis TaxID=3076557 RepID=A0ABZ1DZP1_9RHOB|nr:propanediol utilization protein [Thioclava sp. FTW29]
MARHAAVRVSGHFGEFLQGRLGPSGPVALVSVPCAPLQAVLSVQPSRVFGLHDPMRLLPRDALHRLGQLLRPLRGGPLRGGALRGGALRGGRLRGRLRLATNMLPGAGTGASTAALVAVIRYLAPWLAPQEVMRICWQIEGATDPLAFVEPAAQLWASRLGQGLVPLPAPPPMRIIGGLWGGPERTDPADSHFADLCDLVPQWHGAAQRGDLPEIARLASLSAARTAAIRGPTADPTAQIASQLSCLGYLRAHTGSARGLILERTAPPAQRQAAHDKLRAAGYGRVMEFTLGAMSPQDGRRE